MLAQATLGVWDFGNGYLSALAADGNDLDVNVDRPITITGVQLRMDANPGQTLTLTLTRSGTSGAATATQTVATNGTQTPSGFPINCVAGDRIIVSLSGTSGVTGISYTVKAIAFGG